MIFCHQTKEKEEEKKKQNTEPSARFCLFVFIQQYWKRLSLTVFNNENENLATPFVGMKVGKEEEEKKTIQNATLLRFKKIVWNNDQNLF